MNVKAGLWLAFSVGVALLPGGAAEARPVGTQRAACALVKARIAASWRIAKRRIAFCDVIPWASSPRDFYVLALHSNRRCDGICSTNLGWFAVRKSDGRLFEWDVGEYRLGSPIR
jgi:hypothetical protein